MLNMATMFSGEGFIPKGILAPPLRPHFLVIHSLTYVTSSCFEMLIASERIFSTRKPGVYHVSKINCKVLVTLTIFCYSLGFSVGYGIYIAGHHIIGVVVYNVIDVSTLIINSFGIWYCKKCYESLYGKATLNARYQVFEAYEMARAMHPVYFVSFFLKLIGVLIAYSYFLLMTLFNGKVYALLDFGYFTAHAFNCAFSSAVLMFMHKSLRKSTLALLGCRRTTPVKLISLEGSISDTTKKYFTMLEDSWK